MTVQETSIQAYRETDHTEQKEIVRRFYRENPNTCDGECSRATGVPRALVAARRADLKTDGALFECGHKISPISGKRVLTWGAI